MKKFMLILMVLVMVLSGCKANTLSQEGEEPVVVNPSEVEEATEATKVEVDQAIEEVIAEVETSEAETIDTKVVEAIRPLVEAGDLKAVWSYLELELPRTNGLTGERLILDYMVLAEAQVFAASDPLYEVGWGIHEEIYQVIDEHENEFAQSYVVLGEDKARLLTYMTEENKKVLSEVFDRGYGLISAEGSYYAVVDYEMLLNMPQSPYSEMTMTYLDLQRSALIRQTTIEEYLNISPDELMERCIGIEEFLMTYEERPEIYTDMMTHQLNLCLYKLSLPSPFDNSLDEDGSLSKDFTRIYEIILETEPTPVVTEVVKGITGWIDSREGGYVATYNDSEDLYAISGEIYGKAAERVTALYKD